MDCTLFIPWLSLGAIGWSLGRLGTASGLSSLARLRFPGSCPMSSSCMSRWKSSELKCSEQTLSSFVGINCLRPQACSTQALRRVGSLRGKLWKLRRWPSLSNSPRVPGCEEQFHMAHWGIVAVVDVVTWSTPPGHWVSLSDTNTDDQLSWSPPDQTAELRANLM